MENESHFLLYCPFHDKLRVPFVIELFAQNPEIFWSNDDECLFTFNVYKLASFVETSGWFISLLLVLFSIYFWFSVSLCFMMVSCKPLWARHANA